MLTSNQLPLGVAQEQALVAQQGKSSAPSNWTEYSHSKLPFEEGNPAGVQDFGLNINAGHSLAGVNTATTTNETNETFEDSQDIKDSSLFTYWTCPKCESQWRRSAERLMNLERTGRYFFECKGQSCGVSLVVTRRKDSSTDTVEELQEPFAEGELTIHGKNETVPILKTPMKIKEIRRITKLEMERMKKSWTKSRQFVREKGRAVKDTLGKLTGFVTDNISESDSVAAQHPEGTFKLDSQDRPDTRSPMKPHKTKFPGNPNSNGQPRDIYAKLPKYSPLQSERDVPSSLQSSDFNLSEKVAPMVPPGGHHTTSPLLKPVRRESDGGVRNRWGQHSRDLFGGRLFSFHSNLSSYQLSVDPRKLKVSINASKSAPSLSAIAAGPSNIFVQQSNRKEKQPAKDDDLVLTCRFCTATFPGDDAGDDALLQHVTKLHHDQGVSLISKKSSRELGKVVVVIDEEELEQDDDSLHEEEDELFPSCSMCPMTFNSDQARLKHQAEEHSEDEQFPTCRVCKATFLNKTCREKHEAREHANWYKMPYLDPGSEYDN